MATCSSLGAVPPPSGIRHYTLDISPLKGPEKWRMSHESQPGDGWKAPSYRITDGTERRSNQMIFQGGEMKSPGRSRLAAVNSDRLRQCVVSITSRLQRLVIKRLVTWKVCPHFGDLQMSTYIKNKLQKHHCSQHQIGMAIECASPFKTYRSIDAL